MQVLRNITVYFQVTASSQTCSPDQSRQNGKYQHCVPDEQLQQKERPSVHHRKGRGDRCLHHLPVRRWWYELEELEVRPSRGQNVQLQERHRLHPCAGLSDSGSALGTSALPVRLRGGWRRWEHLLKTNHTQHDAERSSYCAALWCVDYNVYSSFSASRILHCATVTSRSEFTCSSNYTLKHMNILMEFLTQHVSLDASNKVAAQLHGPPAFAFVITK